MEMVIVISLELRRQCQWHIMTIFIICQKQYLGAGARIILSVANVSLYRYVFNNSPVNGSDASKVSECIIQTIKVFTFLRFVRYE